MPTVRRNGLAHGERTALGQTGGPLISIPGVKLPALILLGGETAGEVLNDGCGECVPTVAAIGATPATGIPIEGTVPSELKPITGAAHG